MKFGRTLLCERHAEEIESGVRADHWEKVHLYLDLWLKVATARENETLARLLRYTRLEARVERDLERQALESEARNGRQPTPGRKGAAGETQHSLTEPLPELCVAARREGSLRE